MNKILKLIFLMILLNSIMAAEASVCYLKEYKLITYGGLSCTKAKEVYLSFEKGHIPKGWNCGQSVRGCGKNQQGFVFKKLKI